MTPGDFWSHNLHSLWYAEKGEIPADKGPSCDHFVNKVLFHSLVLAWLKFKYKFLNINIMGSFTGRQTLDIARAETWCKGYSYSLPRDGMEP